MNLRLTRRYQLIRMRISIIIKPPWNGPDIQSTSGQSIGKKLLHLKTTDLQGKNIEAKTAVLESFGKAFLLPVDVILGWIYTNDKRQRIFNRASNTIVIKLKENNPVSNNVTYLKD